MSELRTDPLTGRRVLIAESRSGRPNDFSAERVSDTEDDTPHADCPFCPGNEEQVPTPTLERRDPSGQWRLLVVPNKFPSLAPPDEPADGLCQGGHEVVIETRRHIDRTSKLSEQELAEVLQVYAERLEYWRRDDRFPYRLVFKNVGKAAGASLRHLHSQVIALPEIPPLVVEELKNLENRHGWTGELPWQNVLNGVLADGALLVGEQGGFAAFCPDASRQPYETWLLPTTPQPCFEDLLPTPERFADLARLLHQVLSFIENQVGADYNLVVHTAPTSPGVEKWFHWRIEVVPRLGAIAGFELPTGMYVNTLAPEHAAERLRETFAA